ncbi:MAG: SWIM zinc finger family protein [Bacteroidetes bacterium]|nr:SWIM zinc finger family protein [Bacteroidota bacterium]
MPSHQNTPEWNSILLKNCSCYFFYGNICKHVEVFGGNEIVES